MLAADLYTATQVTSGFVDYTAYTVRAINDSGQAVGDWSLTFGPPDSRHGAFLYDGAGSTLLPLGAATAINGTGQIAGAAFIYNPAAPPGTWTAELYSGGVVTSLGSLPGFFLSIANDINDSGQVVGYASDTYPGNSGPSNAEAFLYSGGIMTGLGFLPGGTRWSVATGINDGGQVVGVAMNSSGHSEAFLYSDGVMTGLGSLPGYVDSVATSINDRGQVVGYATDSSGNSQAFLYRDGVMTGLGALPGDFFSEAYAINNRGQIVGQSARGAFLFDGGRMYDLNSLIAHAQGDSRGIYYTATAINNSGQIVANYRYLLTPLKGRFVAVAPCRVADTRWSPGPFGGPSFTAASVRPFAVPQSACGIPTSALAYSLNVTVVPRGRLSYLTLWPAGLAQPGVSTLNSWNGRVVANAAIVPAGWDGAVNVFVTEPTDVILDIDGYFDSLAGDPFYPVQPCRVADTRFGPGAFGPPSLTAGEIRDFPIPSSSCGLPSTAAAYSMNVTAVPSGYLGFLTTWPTGQPLPNASTLNSWNGTVVANAALVPAGTNGAMSVYVTNPANVILDVDGYFGPSGSPGALNFYPVASCRVADTRTAVGPFGGPEMEAGTTRSFDLPTGNCSIPPTAAAYALNVTVVPDSVLSYLTIWGEGAPQPFVSTLNSFDGQVVANATIVPAGANGGVSIYVTHRTHVILDINGYFAP
jgi:probable HAF family extracellular repeat protein